MTPMKRKINSIIFEEDSFKCRRSSLRVNLSCTSNLTDSDNGSLRQTENVGEGMLTNNSTIYNEADKIHYVNPRQCKNSSNDIRLKNVKVVLENIQSTKQLLDTERQQLRKGISSKTKEIFNLDDELSVKTELILKADSLETMNSSGQCSKQNDIVNSCKITISSIHKTLPSKNMKNINRRIDNHIAKLDLVQNDRNQSSKKFSDNSNLKGGQSTVIRNQGKTNASNTQYNIMKPFCMNPKEKHSNSILSGNELLVTHNRCLNQTSTSSISKDENLSIGPICSSRALAKNKGSAENDMVNCCIQELCDLNTKASAVSMEMTDMSSGSIIDNESRPKNAFDEESNATLHTSLHVNTSIDVYDENSQRERDYRKEQAANQTSSQENNEEHTLQTTYASLHMNTSLCTLGLKKRKRSNRMNNQTLPVIRANKRNSADNQSRTKINNNDLNSSLDDMSLMEKLRNISIPSINQKSKSITEQNCALTSLMCASQCESQWDLNFTTQASRRRNLLSTKNNENIDENDLNNSNGDYSISRNEKFLHTQVKNATIAITSADSSNHAQAAINSLDTVIISDYIKNTKTKNCFDLPKRNKKKLLPLSENSVVVSLIPNEEINTLEALTPRENWGKKKKKQLNKVHININKDNIQPVEKGNFVQAVKNSSIELSSENDFEASQDKNKNEKSKKTTRKKKNANKVISDDVQIFQNTSGGISVKTKLLDLRRNSFTAFQFIEKGNEHPCKSKKFVLVATGLSKQDKDLVKSVVKTLQMARLEANVSKRTTHVISTGVRTLNLLHGIIRGCWLVSMEWVLKSLENNGWLHPEEFEMVHFSKAVTENRKDRQLFGPAYVPELFATCGCIYVESGTIPPCNVLKDLIKTAGGCITDNLQTAKVIIGKKGIRESWVLDCITTGELQLCNKYKNH